MRALRAMHAEIPLGQQRCDAQMTAWALSNSLSREDMPSPPASLRGAWTT
jgi:hypothetical protein